RLKSMEQSYKERLASMPKGIYLNERALVDATCEEKLIRLFNQETS
mgnify:CR=1